MKGKGAERTEELACPYREKEGTGSQDGWGAGALAQADCWLAGGVGGASILCLPFLFLSKGVCQGREAVSQGTGRGFEAGPVESGENGRPCESPRTGGAIGDVSWGAG